LITNWTMIFSILFNGFLHKTRKRGKDVDRRIDLLVMERSINKNLTFCDIASKIWNGMCDIVILNILKITGIDKIGI
jgi:hypothetical protein